MVNRKAMGDFPMAAPGGGRWLLLTPGFPAQRAAFGSEWAGVLELSQQLL
jgi:hypothetical protein